MPRMTAVAAGGRASWFQRFLLPGFALKAVIICGGYAPGRELAEYFVPAGPWGALAVMLFATAAGGHGAALPFALAGGVGAHAYGHSFQSLAKALGRERGGRTV